jgi:succinoglycan biosynthesis transport protein ExoP
LALARQKNSDDPNRSEQSVLLQPKQTELVEDEIDLRRYVDVLRRRWKWIVGLTIAAALLAGIVSLLTPPTFEATAVAIMSNNPSNTGTSTTVFSSQVQFTLMTSPDVSSRVIQTLGDKLPAVQRNPAVLARRVQVKTDATDKSLFQVTVQAAQPQSAADIANAWADAGVAVLNQQANDALGQSIAPLEQAKTKAQSDLQIAEENLKNVERDSQIDPLTEEISRTQQALTTQIIQREIVRASRAQAQTLMQQVQQGQVTLTPELLLNLQTVASSSDASFLIQPSQGTTLTQKEQLDQLDALSAALLAKQTALDQSTERLTQQVVDFQAQLNDKETALIEPQRVRDTARANYDAASAQLRNAQARLVASQNPARVVSRAAAPDSPIQTKLLQNVVVAAALGLLLGVLIAFGVEYFTRWEPAKS